jgi:hypothetical protein
MASAKSGWYRSGSSFEGHGVALHLGKSDGLAFQMREHTHRAVLGDAA